MEYKCSFNDGFALAFFILLGVMLLTCTITTHVSAYEVRLFAPETVLAGESLVVKIETDLPVGTTFPVTFGATNRPGEYLKRYATVQTTNEIISITFETDKCNSGIYKLEALEPGVYRFLGDSRSLIVVNVVNRAGDLTITSASVQYITPENHIVTVSGSVKGNSNAGVNVEISSQNGFYMEPAYYPTDNAGKFSIPFSAPGNGIYLLIFSDSKGYITTKEVSVVMDEMILEPTLTFTPEPTPPPTPDPTPVATTLVTPYPTSTPDTIHTESADVMVYVTIIMALLIFVIGGYLIILWIWNKIRKGGRGGSEWDILG